MIVLITGSNGLLGQKILSRLRDLDVKVIATSKGDNRNKEDGSYMYESLDITNKNEISRVLNLYKPNVVFNTWSLCCWT